MFHITITPPQNTPEIIVPTIRRNSDLLLPRLRRYTNNIFFIPTLDLSSIIENNRIIPITKPILITPAKTIDTCSICLEETSDCETICGHIFHKDCITQIIGNKCPMCRAIINI